tara:strand:+ start:3187 stop:3429 length:243 start_codon:yes stop_codon:yes gene_type:complete
MALFDTIAWTIENFKGYEGNPPSNKTEYDKVKNDMFTGTPPTWTEIKTKMDNYVSVKDSAKAKLIAGEPLTEEEAERIVL